MENHVDKLLDLLPDYLCGVVWSLAVVVLLSFSVPATTAARWTAAVGQVLKPVHIPDPAIGFLIVLFGVLLPYTVAIIFGPFSAAVANLIYHRWYLGKRVEMGLTEEHFRIATQRLHRILQIPTPESGGADLLYVYLRSTKNPLAPQLGRARQLLNIQLLTVLPVSLLLPSIIYGLLGQTWFALLLALIAAGLLFGLIVHLNIGALRRWERAVIVAFLVATASNFSGSQTPAQ